MLDQTARRAPVTLPAAERSPLEALIGLREVLGFLRRQRWPIAIAVGAVLALGALYLVTAAPKYKATASILIDTRKLAIFGTGNVFEDTAINNATVESQVQVLMSGVIADAVVDRLNLTEDAAFMNPPASLAGNLKAAAGWLVGLVLPAPPAVPPTPEKIKQIAAVIFASNLDIERNGLSYVIDVSYTANDPQTAARFANAVAEAYQADQVAASTGAAKRLNDWLQARIAELHVQTEAADLGPQAKAAVRSTYDSLVGRATQIQQQTVPFTDDRVITPAVPPTRKSAPRTTLVIAASLFLGLVGGIGAGLTRELLDRAIRSPQRLETITGLPCLGVLPHFQMKGGAMRRLDKQAQGRQDAAARRFAAGATYSMATLAPFSRYAETLRSIKVAADRALQAGPPVQVLGVVSSLPDEGRTTLAANLARLAAQAGGKVLLIDADFRNPVLSASLVPAGTAGLVQANAGEAGDLPGLIWSEPETHLDFLPAGAAGDYRYGNEILSSRRMSAIMDIFRSRYDLVVVDLPPLAPVVDVRAAQHLFDGFVHIVEWGKTSEDVVIEALNNSEIVGKIVGTVLSKVDMSRLGHYQASSSVVHHDNKYLKSYRHIG